MSFDFGNINPPMKAGAAYKDGSGMGGGGMYFQQKGKRKDQPDDDLFENTFRRRPYRFRLYRLLRLSLVG